MRRAPARACAAKAKSLYVQEDEDEARTAAVYDLSGRTSHDVTQHEAAESISGLTDKCTECQMLDDDDDDDLAADEDVAGADDRQVRLIHHADPPQSVSTVCWNNQIAD